MRILNISNDFSAGWLFCRFFAYRNVADYMGSSFANRVFLKSLADEMENAGLTTEMHEFDVDMGGFSFSYVRRPPITSPAFVLWLPVDANAIRNP